MRLTSTSNARVKAVVRLREGRGSGGRRRTGLFVAEGWREVTRAVEAGLVVREVYVCEGLLAGEGGGGSGRSLGDSLRTGLGGDVEWFETTEAVFRKMANLSEPQGVLAVVEQPRWSLEGLPPVTQETLLLVAAGIEKPGNLGAMVRTAEAAGCQAVLTTGPVDALSPQAIRNSTCAVFALPTIAVDDGELRDWLGERGIRIIATTPAGAVVHTEADLTGPAAIVIGPEDRGLDEAWLAAADARVVIPMRGKLVDSLNASTAAAVVLFESLRQRERAASKKR